MFGKRKNRCFKAFYNQGVTTAIVQPSTGLPALDRVLGGIYSGDNIVWQIESIEDYLAYVAHFCDYAKKHDKKLIYFRFADHQEIVPEDAGAEVYRLDPEAGFERFITRTHEIIKQAGSGVYYVFDSLSELALDCYSERMTGNFFRLTCPYLYQLDCVAYFSVIRNYNSYHAALPIAQTTQVLIDIFTHKKQRYVLPLKVEQRYSPTMHMLHLWKGDDFIPITDSHTISDVLTSGPWHGLQSASYRMVGLWDRRFILAEDILDSYKRGESSYERVKEVFNRQIKQLVSRDEPILSIARKYLSLDDVIHIWKRTIGSGMIGGKAVGMILARAILDKKYPPWRELMEVHDSFYIGSDIFYSFLVDNQCWEIRENQKSPDTLYEGLEEGRERILNGDFPDYIVKRFSDMLDYFGQSPIIVRSSSLLEDNFGNSFAGKYESIFCVNSGTREQRLEEFIDAVRTIYASSMSRKALAYRAKREVLDLDEQMALLVQRVSGSRHRELFFPQLAGVGFSFNSFCWDEEIDPESGLLRLVVGLGTRAVERHDDDYTRVVALNVPAKRPEGSLNEVKDSTQRRIDLLDLSHNRIASRYFIDVAQECPELPLDMLSEIEGEPMVRSTGEKIYNRLLVFEKLFAETDFITVFRDILKVLSKAYGCHVDIEFTAGLLEDGRLKINLLQCRPHRVKTGTAIRVPDRPPQVKSEHLIMKTHKGIIGQSRIEPVDRIIYVVPSVYGYLPERMRYSVAKLVAELARHEGENPDSNIMLIGPGRWCTSMAQIGVPVSFTEIHSASVICEIEAMHEGFVPDLSMGTHFFNDMVEMDMFYMAFFRSQKENVFNEDILLNAPNYVEDIFPDETELFNCVKLLHGDEIIPNMQLILNGNATKQNALLYLEQKWPVR